MKCDRKVGLREITGAKNNRPKAATAERRKSADQKAKWGYAAVFPPRVLLLSPPALVGCPGEGWGWKGHQDHDRDLK